MLQQSAGTNHLILAISLAAAALMAYAYWRDRARVWRAGTLFSVAAALTMAMWAVLPARRDLLSSAALALLLVGLAIESVALWRHRRAKRHI